MTDGKTPATRFRPTPLTQSEWEVSGTKASWLEAEAGVQWPHGPSSLMQVASKQLTLLANTRKGISHRFCPRGRLVVDPSAIVAELMKMGFRVLRWGEQNDQCGLVHEAGYIELSPQYSKPIEGMVVDEGLAKALREKIPTWIRAEEGPGVMHMLQSNYGSLRFDSVGFGGLALVRDNYGPDVLKLYDHVVKDIEAETPCGRLILLNGPTGTGKTHLVRGLLAAAERPRFIVLQPSDLRSLLEASPVAALTEFVHGVRNGLPIVIVIEDADECLLKRGTDNLSQISALLNLTDGLIGSVYDIRIVATTNGKNIEIDPAIVRVERLCRQIEMPALTAEHAARRIAALCADKGLVVRPAPGKPMSVAEVYRAARVELERAA